jgi:hypothetical protein
MATIKIQNVSPLGDLDVPILGRIVTAGEIIDVDTDIAGTTPTTPTDTDPGHGSGLLAQVGAWALPAKVFTPPASTPPPAAPTTNATDLAAEGA